MSVVYAVGGIATLELETLDGPPPAVRVTVSAVAAMTTFTLTRLADGRTQTVPGWREKTFIDSYVDTDSAVPTNRPVTYSLLVNGAVAAAATITLTTLYAWIQDPLQPDKNMPLALSGRVAGMATLDDKSLKSFDYKAAGTEIPIMGSSLPVVFGGQRMDASGVLHRLRTFTDADAALLREIIREAPILLIRPLPEMTGLPALAYVNGDVKREPFTTHLPGGTQQYWTVTGNLVAAVMQAAITGSVTYDEVQQLLAGYTYDEVQTLAAGTTYLDWQKNPLIFSTL
jgi:hypothetical protein